MATRAKRGSRRSRPRPRRWLALCLGLAACGGAAWALLRSPAGEPLGEIGVDSREELHRVLERADREAGP